MSSISSVLSPNFCDNYFCHSLLKTYGYIDTCHPYDHESDVNFVGDFIGDSTL